MRLVPKWYRAWINAKDTLFTPQWTFNSQCSSQWDGFRHYAYQKEAVCTDQNIAMSEIDLITSSCTTWAERLKNLWPLLFRMACSVRPSFGIQMDEWMTDITQMWREKALQAVRFSSIGTHGP